MNSCEVALCDATVSAVYRPRVLGDDYNLSRFPTLSLLLFRRALLCLLAYVPTRFERLT